MKKSKFTFEEWRGICEVMSYFLLATSFIGDKIGSSYLVAIFLEMFLLGYCGFRMILSKP